MRARILQNQSAAETWFKEGCHIIELSNSAGVFQLDQLFREKLAGSGLEPYVELEANIEGEDEKRLFQEFRL